MKIYEEIKKFREIESKQKLRGLNDFNIISIFFTNLFNEVNLHSRFIGKMIDPNEKHFQETLFLEKFLNILKIYDFDLSNSTVYIEKDNIDLLITDNKKFIIIENKLMAEDQPCQIIRYINKIIKNKKIKPTGDIVKDIIVVYLTLKKDRIPKNHIVENNYIYYKNSEELKKCDEGLKNYKAIFRHITYKEDIRKWIKECKKEIKNITNLNYAFSQYLEVIDKICNQYTPNRIQLYEYIMNKEELFKEVQKLYINIEKGGNLGEMGLTIKESYEKIRKIVTSNFFKNDLICFLKEKLKDCKVNLDTDSIDYKIEIICNNNKIIFSSENYKTTADFFKCGNKKEYTKYKYRYSENSINDFYYNNGKNAKEYYLKKIYECLKLRN